MSKLVAFIYRGDQFKQSSHACSYDTTRAVHMLSNPSMREDSHVGRNNPSRFSDILDYLRHAKSERSV